MSDTSGHDDIDPADGRPESEEQRADRNWSEILQELRVTQTGTQLISGFLLAIAFQQRFGSLAPPQVAFYLVLVVLAAGCTALGLAPVALHRQLFRHHEKVRTVAIANRLLRVTIALVAVLTSGVVAFIFDVTLGLVPALVAGAALLVLLALLLLAFPARVLSRLRRPPA
ncbi:DUF6328 family protein [Leifsonia sp. TF02-11]|uniref:DUF6328 family protein n=1 Tax=Leifsonia sp. TF02-11 TaxID=2815212 RepID=UPI001AA12B71|nr:DUF6328 family protein [Leifsonia sp. TF02-11]MBN9629009.1 hypothetical protein [Actinomycetota bacterium]MBO1737714.1 sodium:proton antiporter [Leifsonia sp. TF02-11]